MFWSVVQNGGLTRVRWGAVGEEGSVSEKEHKDEATATKFIGEARPRTVCGPGGRGGKTGPSGCGGRRGSGGDRKGIARGPTRCTGKQWAEPRASQDCPGYCGCTAALDTAVALRADGGTDGVRVRERCGC